MKKYFNIAGPCNPKDHYMIDAFLRVQDVMGLIEQNQYFVIHAPRQSGKTTLLLDLTQRLNASGNYYALYCSLETVQGIIEAEKGVGAIVRCIKSSVQFSGIPNKEFANSADFDDFNNILKNELSLYTRKLDKPFVIFFDEADCLSDDTLISFLRQLRNGYNTRAQIPFVHSLALVGMRNIRDFKAKIRPDIATLGSSSPFNIVTEALTLANFTKQEISHLYNEHTQLTGQVFEEESIEKIWLQTKGQPWLVNAVAREVIVKLLNFNYSLQITEKLVEEAIQNIILRRDTHIDSLLERLKEPRVLRVIQPIILGESGVIDKYSDDYSYTKDLGLIRDEENRIEMSNPIYAEVIIRTLSSITQDSLRTSENNYNMPRYLKSGKIDMDFLIQDFQEFWRENSDIWIERYEYKEAAPHLILQAFLQRVINGGGRITREMAAERRRIDLCVEYANHKYPIELKLRRNEKTFTEGIEQISRYMNSLGCSEGWLVVFDRRTEIDWDTKLFIKKELIGDKTITLVGC